MDWQDRIVIDADILAGKPVIKGTRLAVSFIVDLLAQGWSEAEILENYPGVTPEDIQACLHSHPHLTSARLRLGTPAPSRGRDR